MAKDEEQSEPVEKPEGSKKKLIMIIGGVVGVLVIAGAALFFTGFFDAEKSEATTENAEQSADDVGSDNDDVSEGEVEDAETGAVIYHALTPPFMVNFSGGSIQVMKLAVSVMASEQAVIDAVALHDPVIRNNILMMLSSEDPEVLKSASGKSALQKAIKAEINKVLNNVKVSSTVKNVFFTDLVMQ